jgi:hypothetical protein
LIIKVFLTFWKFMVIIRLIFFLSIIIMSSVTLIFYTNWRVWIFFHIQSFLLLSLTFFTIQLLIFKFSTFTLTQFILLKLSQWSIICHFSHILFSCKFSEIVKFTSFIYMSNLSWLNFTICFCFLSSFNFFFKI